MYLCLSPLDGTIAFLLKSLKQTFCVGNYKLLEIKMLLGFSFFTRFGQLLKPLK